MKEIANRGKIIVCCPGSLVTGGPELLHQLVHVLRGLKHEAYICYHPFDESHECPDTYKYYDAPQMKIEDQEQNIIVLPETCTTIARDINKAKVAIWWLSVDNYFRRKGNGWVRDSIKSFLSLYNRRLPFFRLRQFMHFSQSAYARNFLLRAGVAPAMLSDYLAPEHMNQKPCDDGRENIIVYNPNKGFSTTRKLIKACPDLKFVPIQGMTKPKVAGLFSRAKIYIDFGHHPGKDRMPREAAMAGCCVITGLQGAAGNDEDIPVYGKYKLDDGRKIDAEKFTRVVESIFADFESHSLDFEAYRKQISSELDVFTMQVIDIFGHGEERNDLNRLMIG